MQIIHYPHPTLRRASKPLRTVDAELRNMVRQMFDLMYQHKGIGLAANQVDLPYQLFILNVSGDPDLADQEQVFINPVLSQPKGSEEKEEGCLSLPGVWADVRRPEKISLNAYDLSGREFKGAIDGLFGRAVQHEVDHLHGVLFIDRLAPTAKMEIRGELEEFELRFAKQLERGEVANEQGILARLAELERQRT